MNPKPKPTKGSGPKKSKPAKIKKADPDYWFSLCVRERDGWTCTACHKHYEPNINQNTGLPGTQSLQCSHYIGRGNYSVRFEPMNADAHCASCHRKFEGNPHRFLKWKMRRVGIDSYDVLIEKSDDIMLGKQARHEVREIEAHFKAEFFKMRETGIKQFVGYL